MEELAEGRRERTMKKRHAILEAAAGLFGRRGFHDTRVEEIADLAGVAKGTVYEYFPSKEDLFKGIIHTSFERYLTLAKEAGDGDLSAGARLRALIQASLAFALENRNLARMMLDNPPNCKADLRDHILMTRQHIREVYVGIIEDGITAGEFRPLDPHSAAGMVLGAVQEVVLQSIFCKEVRRSVEVVDQLIDFLMGGLCRYGPTITGFGPVKSVEKINRNR